MRVYNIKFKFQVFPSHQDRKTNSFVCFWGKVTARQSCFEIDLDEDCDFMWIKLQKEFFIALQNRAFNQKIQIPLRGSTAVILFFKSATFFKSG